MKEYCSSCNQELDNRNRFSSIYKENHPVFDLICCECGTKIKSNFRRITVRAMTATYKRASAGRSSMYKDRCCGRPKHIHLEV